MREKVADKDLGTHFPLLRREMKIMRIIAPVGSVDSSYSIGAGEYRGNGEISVIGADIEDSLRVKL